MLGRSFSSCRDTGFIVLRLSMGTFASSPSVVFPVHFHVTHTHASPRFLSLAPRFYFGLFVVNVRKGHSIDLIKVVLVRPYYFSSGMWRDVVVPGPREFPQAVKGVQRGG